MPLGYRTKAITVQGARAAWVSDSRLFECQHEALAMRGCGSVQGF